MEGGRGWYGIKEGRDTVAECGGRPNRGRGGRERKVREVK